MSAPIVQYARSDGLHIAYQVIGHGPVDLVLTPGYVSHGDLNWTNPAYVDFVERLSSFARVIMFDKRGTGLSDVSADAANFEARMNDIGIVMEAAGCDHAVLLGFSEGGPMASLFAATHSDRVDSLVLVGTFAGGHCIPKDTMSRLEDAVAHWGEGRTADIFFSEAPGKSLRRFIGLYERAAASPGVALGLLRSIQECDVAPVLPLLHVPTLVLHRRGDPFADVSWGRAMAEAIPDARFVEVEGSEHLPWMGDIGPLVAAVEAHVTGRVVGGGTRRVMATVIFTDIVDSTRALSSLGDEGWAATIQRHNDICRDVFEEFDAWAVKSTGDGFVACVSSPERAVRCVDRIRASTREIGLQIRAGLHTGALERVDVVDIAGLTVNVAARVAALAGPDETLATELTADLLIGSRYSSRMIGPKQLKGVSEPVVVVSVVGPSEEPSLDGFDRLVEPRDGLTLRAARRMPWLLRRLAKYAAR